VAEFKYFYTSDLTSTVKAVRRMTTLVAKPTTSVIHYTVQRVHVKPGQTHTETMVFYSVRINFY